jgi:hypothetical protein
MRFRVTKKHILKGKSFDASHCPVALAIRAKIPRKHIDVGGRFITIGKDWYVTPIKVTKFISGFDSKSSVKSFEFSLSRKIPEDIV